MCPVHTGTYDSLLAPGKTGYTACHPRKTTTYIARSTDHYAYARQTLVTWKKEAKKEKKIKERKEKTRKRKNEKGKEI